MFFVGRNDPQERWRHLSNMALMHINMYVQVKRVRVKLQAFKFSNQKKYAEQ